MTSCKTSKYVVMSGLVTMQRILPLAGTITPAMLMFQISLVTYELEHLLMVNRRVLNTLSKSYSIRSVSSKMIDFKTMTIFNMQELEMEIKLIVNMASISLHQRVLLLHPK